MSEIDGQRPESGHPGSGRASRLLRGFTWFVGGLAVLLVSVVSLQWLYGVRAAAEARWKLEAAARESTSATLRGHDSEGEELTCTFSGEDELSQLASYFDFDHSSWTSHSLCVGWSISFTGPGGELQMYVDGFKTLTIDEVHFRLTKASAALLRTLTEDCASHGPGKLAAGDDLALGACGRAPIGAEP